MLDFWSNCLTCFWRSCLSLFYIESYHKPCIAHSECVRGNWKISMEGKKKKKDWHSITCNRSRTVVISKWENLQHSIFSPFALCPVIYLRGGRITFYCWALNISPYLPLLFWPFNYPSTWISSFSWEIIGFFYWCHISKRAMAFSGVTVVRNKKRQKHSDGLFCLWLKPTNICI